MSSLYICSETYILSEHKIVLTEKSEYPWDFWLPADLGGINQQWNQNFEAVLTSGIHRNFSPTLKSKLQIQDLKNKLPSEVVPLCPLVADGKRHSS